MFSSSSVRLGSDRSGPLQGPEYERAAQYSHHPLNYLLFITLMALKAPAFGLNSGCCSGHRDQAFASDESRPLAEGLP